MGSPRQFAVYSRYVWRSFGFSGKAAGTYQSIEAACARAGQATHQGYGTTVVVDRYSAKVLVTVWRSGEVRVASR